MVALGLGADGVCPYVMVEVALMDGYADDISNLASALRKGIEKVISTIGIHEVRGYAQLFSCIGVKPELTTIFDTPAYFASEKGGTGFAQLDTDGDERQRILSADEDSKPAKTFRFYPGLQGGRGRRQQGRQLRGVLGEGPPPRARDPISLQHPRPRVGPATPWLRHPPRSACTTTRSSSPQ